MFACLEDLLFKTERAQAKYKKKFYGGHYLKRKRKR